MENETQKTKKKYYIELCYTGEIEPEELVDFIQLMKEKAERLGLKPLPSRVKENPEFDSFGNLWE